jgi:dipeptidyl aminopeptidase/acylaminoacyl peptidase
LNATRNAAWVGADSFNGTGTEVHLPPKFWQCPPGEPCTPGDPLPWVENTSLYADPWSDAWVRFNLDRQPLGLQALDAPTGTPLGPVVELDALFGGAVAIPRDRSWMVVNRTDQADLGRMQVHALPSGERIATLDVEAGVLGVAMPPAEDAMLWFNPTNGRSFLLRPGTWTVEPSPLGDGEVAAAAYSQDGRWLVTADTTGDLVIREPASLRELRRMSSAGAASRGGFVFSDDGRYLVSNQDGKGRLWDVDSGELIGQPIEGAPAVASAAFPGEPAGFVTADGRHVQVWRFDPPTWLDIACKAAGRNLTRAEWDQYGPRDRPYRATCPQWPAGR